ncbi:MAG TPA: hypothetical protein VF634_04315 [Pyrinomonadaceae bacterium]
MTEDSRSIHFHALPNYEKAVILRDKLEGYVLNPTHDEGKHKARVFKSALGFEQSDWEELTRRILDELPYHEAISQGEGLWGRKYLVILPIAGLNGNTADVETVWIIKPKTDFPTLVTTLVAKR